MKKMFSAIPAYIKRTPFKILFFPFSSQPCFGGRHHHPLFDLLLALRGLRREPRLIRRTGEKQGNCYINCFLFLFGKFSVQGSQDDLMPFPQRWALPGAKGNAQVHITNLPKNKRGKKAIVLIITFNAGRRSPPSA